MRRLLPLALLLAAGCAPSPCESWEEVDDPVGLWRQEFERLREVRAADPIPVVTEAELVRREDAWRAERAQGLGNSIQFNEMLKARIETDRAELAAGTGDAALLTARIGALVERQDGHLRWMDGLRAEYINGPPDVLTGRAALAVAKGAGGRR